MERAKKVEERQASTHCMIWKEVPRYRHSLTVLGHTDPLQNENPT